MAGHIGIVAVSGPGAALCYQTICAEAGERMGLHAHPEVSLHAFSFAEHVRLMEQGDWAGVGDLMARSAGKLAALGADFAICPDNTAHQAFERAQQASPIPWLHIAEAVVEEAGRRGAKRLAVLGTGFLMEGPVYREAIERAGLEWRIPPREDRERIHRLIFDDLVLGRVPEAGRHELLRIIGDLGRQEGCDAVVLGCTELPLAVPPEQSPLPTLDSTRLLARAAIGRAFEA